MAITFIQAPLGSGMTLDIGRLAPVPDRLKYAPSNGALRVDQGWWGHPAPKPTYLYIVGTTRDQVGDLPVQLHRAGGRTVSLSAAERERTPVAFARFLVRLASVSQVGVTVAPARSNSDLAAQSAAAKRAAFRAWAGA